ncbi:tRNA modification GTPase gtpbp3, mitochondrial, partial [Spiromyces aspiralis]
QRRVAIVSPQAGTTRDVIETTLNIGGYPVVVGDTAGIREATDIVEREGIQRALEAVKNSDFRIIVLDSSSLRRVTPTAGTMPKGGLRPSWSDAVQLVRSVAGGDDDNNNSSSSSMDKTTTLFLFNKWDQVVPSIAFTATTTDCEYSEQLSATQKVAEDVGIPPDLCLPMSCTTLWGWDKVMRRLKDAVES